MKLSILSTSMAVAMASAQGSYDTWAPGGTDDFRGPCPMMNTLANHNFLPHDGRNITLANAIHALGTAINFNETLATIMWQQAIFVNSEPNATFFTLDQLNPHNVLEHDASMSRLDAQFGNNHVFNQEVFDTTKQFWTSETLDADQLANGKVYRQLVSRATNPNYRFTETIEQFSLGEVAAPLIVFGDHESATVNRSFVTYMIENERLPTELGWTRQAASVQLADVMRLTGIIADAATLITVDANTTTTNSTISKRGAARRASVRIPDLHSGMA